MRCALRKISEFGLFQIDLLPKRFEPLQGMSLHRDFPLAGTGEQLGAAVQQLSGLGNIGDAESPQRAGELFIGVRGLSAKWREASSAWRDGQAAEAFEGKASLFGEEQRLIQRNRLAGHRNDTLAVRRETQPGCDQFEA